MFVLRSGGLRNVKEVLEADEGAEGGKEVRVRVRV